MPDRRYEIRATGRLSRHAQDMFAQVDVSEVSADTVITGVVHDGEQLHQMLSVMQALGLHVLSVQQVAL